MKVNDSAAAFCARRNSEVSKRKQRAGLELRKRWALKLVTWVEHLHRHPSHPGMAMLNSQSDEWLRERRHEAGHFNSARTVHAGETRTRSGAGTPNRWCSRWLETIAFSEDGWPNPQKNKRFSEQKANFLFLHFIMASQPDCPMFGDD